MTLSSQPGCRAGMVDVTSEGQVLVSASDNRGDVEAEVTVLCTPGHLLSPAFCVSVSAAGEEADLTCPQRLRPAPAPERQAGKIQGIFLQPSLSESSGSNRVYLTF